MRVALISDIHGNLVSLNAVLADIDRERVDDIICLGDVATLGPQPSEVVTRLQTLDCHFIAGNHDADLLDTKAAKQRQTHSQIILDAVMWCAEQLSVTQIEFLRSFRDTSQFQLDADTSLLCFHGSPQSNTDIILATTPADEL